jgi:hypothetical protein
MALRLPAVLAAAAVLALAAAGCGEKPKVDTDQIRGVVEQFALASDASACDLLSPKALTNLYGEFKKKNVDKARAECVRKSKHFKGEKISIDNVNVIDDERVRVSAIGADGEIAYGVSLRRYGSKWLIESISQAKND